MSKVKYVTIVIDGNPVAKGRPRLTTRGGYAHAYTPVKTRTYEEQVASAGKNAMEKLVALEGAIAVEIAAYMPIPKSLSKKDRAAMLSGEIQHTKKPDFDNLAKVIDGLNGIAWVDDCQIVDAHVSKKYSDNPRLEVTVFHFNPFD